MRSAWQGVGNIVRFNWHFYAAAAAGVALALALGYALGGWWLVVGWCVAFGTVATTLVSLVVSWYVYDRSGLYRLDWLPDLPAGVRIVNINAGFDETSALLQRRYPEADLTVLDFYDPARHPEVSIERARRAYPPYPGTRSVATDDLPLPAGGADAVFLVLAAHEIRDDDERAVFFGSLGTALRPGGRIYVVEHLRDLPNFFAYSLGAFHFLPYADWALTFSRAGLAWVGERKLNPFVSLFTLARTPPAALSPPDGSTP